jgi:hypothetical protein
MAARKPARMPDLDFDAEARANLRQVLARPHHPTAAQNNLAKEKRSLREARSREAEALEN